MERDFTMEKYEELCGYLPSDSEKFSDFFGDMGLKNYDDYPDGLGTDLATIQSYYINVLDNNDMTKGELNNIFCHAREADDSYANILKAITELAESYKMYQEKMLELMCVSPGDFTSEEVNKQFIFATEDYYKSTYLYMRSIVEDAKWNWNNISEEDKKKLDEYYEELAVYYRENNKIESMDEDEKAFLIWYFEAKHPEYVQNMNTCLTPISEAKRDDIVTNIKLYAYMAPEPFRTVYLEMAGDIKIVDTEYKGTPNYDAANGGISIDLDKFNYTTFFHECGHMLDDLWSNEGYFTQHYTNDEEKTLNQVLESEVRENIRRYAEEYLSDKILSESDRKKIIKEVEDAFMNCYNSQGYEPFKPGTICDKCFTKVKEELKGDIKNIASDIYGGYTGNLLNTGYGHNVIKVNADGNLSAYWVDSSGYDENKMPIPNYKDDGSLTYQNQEKEFFAEYFAANITHKKFAIAGLHDELLNDSTKFADEYMHYICENIDELKK